MLTEVLGSGVGETRAPALEDEAETDKAGTGLLPYFLGMLFSWKRMPERTPKPRYLFLSLLSTRLEKTHWKAWRKQSVLAMSSGFLLALSHVTIRTTL